MEIVGTVGTLLNQKGSQLWTILPDATVFDAIQRMAEKNVGALLVMEGDRLMGIISERDYTRKVILKGRSSKESPVREIMTPQPVTVSPHDSIAECMRVVAEKRVRHLPVLDGDKVVGVLSVGDLVKWTISAQETTIDQLEKFITGAYPA
jgi:CBS domain-containing protein